MPDLGLPLILGNFTPQIMVTLFVKANFSTSDIQLIRDSVSIGRKILAKSGIGLAVIPPGGVSSREHIGVFTHSGSLYEEFKDSYGRTQSRGPGGITARTEVQAKMTGKVDRAVVLFGDASAQGSRGYTEVNSNFPYYCIVKIAAAAKTTMLHEVGHCADMQHYMANRDLTDPATADEKNIMAEVTDAKADLRDNLNRIEIDLLKRSYFFGMLD